MKINGTSFKLYIPTEDIDNDSSTTTWKAAAAGKSSTLNVNIDLPDSTTKDASAWAEHINGLRDWDVSFDGLTDMTQTLAAGTPNARAFFQIILDRSKNIIAWGQEGYHFYGKVSVSNLSLNSDMEQPVGHSVTLKGDGALSITADGSTDIDSSATYPEA